MTGSITFVVDCSSFQGDPDWLKVAAVCRGGMEKVTEGAGSTAYANPRWPRSKQAMAAVAKHGFVPAAYLFLDAVEPGGAQADWFAKNAGNLDGFGVVVDFERAPNGSPTRAIAVAAVAELRKLYPHHPVGGYAPHWYTGGEDLRFVDWLWASEYVIGSGDPARLYTQVPASWWAPYGGRHPLMLQFTDHASVAGIAGPVDCSAFHGTPGDLAARVLPAAAKPAPAPAKPPVNPGGPDKPAHPQSGAADMLIELSPGQPPASFPVWAHAIASHEPVPYQYCSLVLTGGAGAVVKVTIWPPTGKPEIYTPLMAEGKAFVVAPKSGWHSSAVVELQRLDTKGAVGASAVFRTW